jgi:hypothetical protein
MLVYHLRNGEEARWWPLFRDVVSPHRHDQCSSRFTIRLHRSCDAETNEIQMQIRHICDLDPWMGNLDDFSLHLNSIHNNIQQILDF